MEKSYVLSYNVINWRNYGRSKRKKSKENFKEDQRW